VAVRAAKDGLLLRTNPYQVLEGLAIAAYAVGAERAYIGLKETFTVELQALTRALGEMQDADALGPVPVELVLGPDLYLFGEETGLEEVIEGRPPLPRVARPFIQGLFAQPRPTTPPSSTTSRRWPTCPTSWPTAPTGCGRMGPKPLRARWSSPSAGMYGTRECLSCRLVRARGSTGGQKCALPTGESLLMQSLVQAFGEEFASHVGRSCPLPRELPFHKLVDWDATAGRFAYDLAYPARQPDWTYSS
jgi:Respiratory-chain NADH dehydrogenase 51 Kd subunit